VSARPSGFRVAKIGVALALGGAWHAVGIVVLIAAVLWADEIAVATVKALRAALKEVRERARQRRELNRRRMELEAALAWQGQGMPLPCAPRQAVPVLVDGDVVAWLCPACDTQLPANFGGLQTGHASVPGPSGNQAARPAWKEGEAR
jgi:hypothetical protein